MKYFPFKIISRKQIYIFDRVKSGNFGHQVNSDVHLQTVENLDETAPYEPSHQDFHCLFS